MAGYQPIQYAYTTETVKPQITVTGLKEAIDMLEGLPKGLVATGFAKALDAGGEVFQDELQRNTPFRKSRPSTPGALTAGDIVEGTKLAQSLRRRVVIDSQYRGGFCTIDFGKMNHVALWVEYGHALVTHWANKERTIGSKRIKKWGGHQRIGTVPAHPFIRPSAEFAEAHAVDRFVSTLQETIDAYVSKYGRAA